MRRNTKSERKVQKLKLHLHITHKVLHVEKNRKLTVSSENLILAYQKIIK